MTVFIPRVEAEAFERHLSEGTTQPTVLGCVHLESGDYGSYAVKYRKSRGDHCYEFLCISLARYFDIATLDPVLVLLTEEFGGSLMGRDRELADRVLANVGWNFGTKYLTGRTLPEPDKALRGVRGRDAARILAFDMLISNSDRHPARKINLLADGNRIVVIDHELAFGCTADVLGFRSWRDEATRTVRGHVFAGRIPDIDERLGGFTDRLKALTDDDIDRIVGELPKEFPCHHEDKIKAHLRRARDEHEEFVWAVLEEGR